MHVSITILTFEKIKTINMTFGYFVVYGDDAHEKIVQELEVVGCVQPSKKMIYWDRITRIGDPSPCRERVIDLLREGDTLIIPNLFDLCRTWKKIETFEEVLSRRGIKVLVGIDERIEFSGDAVFLLTSFIKKHNEYQTRAGNAARNYRTSENVGAPKGPRDKEKAMRAYALFQVRGEGEKRKNSYQDIVDRIGGSVSSVRRWVEWAEGEIQ